MNVPTKNRTELKAYYKTNDIPTEANYASLIDAVINQKEDGVAKVSGQPLSIQADGDAAGVQPLLSFYKSFADANPTWTINQNPRTVANNPATKKPGLNITDTSGASRLFIKQDNGNIGIGTIEPSSKLEVSGDIKATGNITAKDSFVGQTGHSGYAGLSHKNSTSSVGYALLQKSDGTTFLNAASGRNLHFRIANSDKMTLSSSGDLSIPNNNLSFGSTTRQMINLWSTSYGLGVQDSTTYFRTGAHFAWHKGGSHSNTALNAGSGGTPLMILNSSAQLGIGTNPSYPLHVKGGDNVGLFESTGSQAYLRLHHNEGLNKRIELCCRAGGRASLWVSSAGDVLNVLPAGRVGIGTTNPTTDRLEVHKNWHDTNTNDWGGGLKLVGNAPTISFWETDNGNHRWMWHLSGDTMNLYRRPAGGSFQRHLYVESNGNLQVSGQYHGGHAKAGRIQPPHWAYSHQSNSWGKLYGQTVNFPKASILTVSVNGHVRTENNGWMYVKVMIDGNVVSDGHWNGALVHTSTWSTLGLTVSLEANAGNHEIAVAASTQDGNTKGWVNGSTINYTIIPK